MASADAPPPARHGRDYTPSLSRGVAGALPPTPAATLFSAVAPFWVPAWRSPFVFRFIRQRFSCDGATAGPLWCTPGGTLGRWPKAPRSENLARRRCAAVQQVRARYSHEHTTSLYGS